MKNIDIACMWLGMSAIIICAILTSGNMAPMILAIVPVIVQLARIGMG